MQPVVLSVVFAVHSIIANINAVNAVNAAVMYPTDLSAGIMLFILQVCLFFSVDCSTLFVDALFYG